MRIKPGIGTGSIKYGITETTLVKLLGSPDLTQEEEYLEGEGDWHLMLWYYLHGKKSFKFFLFSFCD